MRHLTFSLLVVILSAFLAGCGGDGAKPGAKAPASSGAKTAASSGDTETGGSESSGGKRRKFKPIQVGTAAEGTAGEAAGGGEELTGEKRTAAVIKELQPFQILLGQWRWVTSKKFGGFAKSGEETEWVWDFRTDRSQPALRYDSEKNPYFAKAWLTYIPNEQKFRLTTESAEEKRVLEGTWADEGEPKEVMLDNKKPDRTYKLQLTQVQPAAGEQWQVNLNQQENNRYLFELKKRPAGGKMFGPLDTVAQQRLNTSFAVADSDNPGPKCIISGGLGSMTVTYMGKSYPVCCSGCAAAFKDEPERWLAKLAQAEAAKKKNE